MVLKTLDKLSAGSSDTPESMSQNEHTILPEMSPEEEMLQLEEFFSGFPSLGSVGILDLDRFAGSIVYSGISRFSHTVDGKGWGDEEDLKQSARAGIFKGWKDILYGTDSFLSYAESYTESHIKDQSYMKKIIEESDERGLTSDEVFEQRMKIAYMRRTARSEVRRFVQSNMGHYGSLRHSRESSIKAFSSLFPDITDTMDEEEFIDRISRKVSEDQIDGGLLSLAYHNASAEDVIETTCALLNIDREVNFPDRDMGEDAQRIQELFLDTVIETLARERMYSGLGPDGKPRFRKIDHVTIEVEKWCVHKVLYEGERSITLGYIKDFIKEKPDDWGHVFTPRGAFMEDQKNADDYETIRRKVYDVLLNKQAILLGSGKLKGGLFSEDGSLNITRVPDFLFAEIRSLSPDLIKGIQNRQAAWKRIRALLIERRRELVLLFEDKVFDYLLDDKNEDRIW